MTTPGEGVPDGSQEDPRIASLEKMASSLGGLGEQLKGIASPNQKKESLAISLGAKKKEIYKKIVESYKGPKSFEVGYKGAHEALRQKIMSDVLPIVNDDFWKSPDFKEVVAGLNRNSEVAKMFANDVVDIILGKLDRNSLDSYAKRQTKTFSLSVNTEGRLDLTVSDGGEAPQKVDPKKEEIDAGVKELKESGGLVTMVLGLLGVIDTSKSDEEIEKQYRSIVNGNNPVGKIVCGFFGFKFARKDVEKVIGIVSSKNPEMGDKAKGWMEKLSGYRSDLAGETSEEDTKVKKKRVLEDLRMSGGDGVLKETVEFEDFQFVGPNEELTLTIPAGGFVKLVNEDKVEVVDLGTQQPVEFVSGQKLEGGPGGRSLRIASGQSLDEGTVFAKGVRVDFNKARGSTGGKGGSFSEFMAAKDDGKEKPKEKKDNKDTKEKA